MPSVELWSHRGSKSEAVVWSLLGILFLAWPAVYQSVALTDSTTEALGWPAFALVELAGFVIFGILAWHAGRVATSVVVYGDHIELISWKGVRRAFLLDGVSLESNRILGLRLAFHTEDGWMAREDTPCAAEIWGLTRREATELNAILSRISPSDAAQ